MRNLVCHKSRWPWRAMFAAAALSGLAAHAAVARDQPREPGVLSTEVVYAGGHVRVSWRPALFAVPTADLLAWIAQSARAVSLYFGHFPVGAASLTVDPAPANVLSRGSATSGSEPRIALELARSITARGLERETVLVHEMTHLAVPALDTPHIWLQEGVATYVEFVARAQAGISTPEEVWARFMEDMPTGLPDARDPGGLDESYTPGRRYWGGALFCLVADIRIRKATGNRLGLQDALRAVQREGGNLTRAWPIDKVLAVADRENGRGILKALYRSHGTHPATVDLDMLWRDLGVRIEGRRVVLDDSAPLADIRDAITGRPSAPLLVASPRLVREAPAVASGPGGAEIYSAATVAPDPRAPVLRSAPAPARR